MIVTLTLNPALDKSTDTDRLIPEKKIRCSYLKTEAGGGGINVSKAIQELGGKSHAIFPYGGLNGKTLLHLLEEHNIVHHGINVSGNTRESFAVEETSSNKQFRFVMPGEILQTDEIEEILHTIINFQNISYLICSGSLPKGVTPEIFSRIAEIAIQKKIKLIVDTSGEPLKAVLKKGVFLLKPNLTELCFLAGKEHLDYSEIEETASQILQDGNCEVMIVSMGSSGAMMLTKDKVKTFSAPIVKKISTVGAGDSMIAGITWMLEKNEPLEMAVRFGVACGSAATINKGSRLFIKDDALRFYEKLKKENL